MLSVRRPSPHYRDSLRNQGGEMPERLLISGSSPGQALILSRLRWIESGRESEG